MINDRDGVASAPNASNGDAFRIFNGDRARDATRTRRDATRSAKTVRRRALVGDGDGDGDVGRRARVDADSRVDVDVVDIARRATRDASTRPRARRGRDDDDGPPPARARGEVDAWTDVTLPLSEDAREAFMREYWQKKPLLMRQAIPNFRPPLDGNEIAGFGVRGGRERAHLRARGGRRAVVEEEDLGPFEESDFDVVTRKTSRGA